MPMQPKIWLSQLSIALKVETLHLSGAKPPVCWSATAHFISSADEVNQLTRSPKQINFHITHNMNKL